MQFLRDNGSLSRDNRISITKLQEQYKNIIRRINNETNPENSKLLYYKISPIPDNIVKLQTETINRISNNNNNQKNANVARKKLIIITEFIKNKYSYYVNVIKTLYRK